MSSQHSKDSQRLSNMGQKSVIEDYDAKDELFAENADLSNDGNKHSNKLHNMHNNGLGYTKDEVLDGGVNHSYHGRFGKFKAFFGGSRGAGGAVGGAVGVAGVAGGAADGGVFGVLDGVSSWVSCRSYRFSIVNSVLFVGLLGWFGNYIAFCVASGLLFVAMVTFIKLQCWLNVLFITCGVIDSKSFNDSTAAAKSGDKSSSKLKDDVVKYACDAFDCCACEPCCGDGCCCDDVNDIGVCKYGVDDLIKMYKQHSMREIVSAVVYVLKGLTAQYLYGWFVVAAIIVSSCFMVVFGCALMYSQIYASYAYAFGVFLVAMQFAILSFSAIHLAKNKGDARGFLDICIGDDDMLIGLDGVGENCCNGGSAAGVGGKSKVDSGNVAKHRNISKSHKLKNETDAKHIVDIGLPADENKADVNNADEHSADVHNADAHSADEHKVLHHKHKSAHDRHKSEKHVVRHDGGRHDRDVKDEKRGKHRNSSYDTADLIGLGLHENRNKL